MKTEPVAWIMKEDLKKMEKGAVVQFVYRCQQFSMPDNKPKKQIALYTNPVKELTNDEMRKVINEIVDGVTVSEMVTFLAISRAILKRAQEK